VGAVSTSGKVGEDLAAEDRQKTPKKTKNDTLRGKTTLHGGRTQGPEGSKSVFNYPIIREGPIMRI